MPAYSPLTFGVAAPETRFVAPSSAGDALGVLAPQAAKETASVAISVARKYELLMKDDTGRET